MLHPCSASCRQLIVADEDMAGVTSKKMSHVSQSPERASLATTCDCQWRTFCYVGISGAGP